MAEAASPSSHSSFCEEVFSRSCSRPAVSGRFLARQQSAVTTGITNEVDRTNILAPGL
jgi:hypothetical protein